MTSILIKTLPNEMWEQVLHNSHLNLKDTYSTMQVNSDFYQIATNSPIFKVGQFNRWVKNILDISREHRFIFLQKLGNTWLDICQSYFKQRNEGNIVQLREFEKSIVQYRSIFSEILSDFDSDPKTVVSSLNGCKLLPPDFLLNVLTQKDKSILNQDASARNNILTSDSNQQIVEQNRTEITLFDMGKMSMLFPEIYICETNRTIIESQLHQALTLDPEIKLVWTLRPSESNPGKVVFSRIAMSSSNTPEILHTVIETQGKLASYIRHVYMRKKTKPLIQVFTEHNKVLDETPNLSDQALSLRKHNLWQEVQKLHNEKSFTFFPNIDQTKAEIYLKDQKTGTFLIRYAQESKKITSDPEPSFVLSVNSDGAIHHYEITIHPKRGMLMINMMLYNSLSSFLELTKNTMSFVIPFMGEDGK